ncbi:hypothetical protein A8U91_01307 [Halomonas elongata]|uniref:Uncharacterized protein n=1 Tax=Halomonas elongata TaxID=2746 RepID=A0A1B8P3Z8_HALEL|nr:hypothetical protein [Halomonas elongata]OBX36959.1 hypothetical protein A8U91_01307 [Halomonas elongata]
MTGYIRFSRYHIAKMFEMRDGLGWSYRQIAKFVGASPSGVRRAMVAAEQGQRLPEVTPFYCRVCPEEVA